MRFKFNGKLFITFLVLLSLNLFLPLYAGLAQEPKTVTQYKEPIGPPAPIPTLCDIRGKKDAGELFQTVYLCAMGFTGVAALLTLTVGGVWYLMAGGNEKMIGQAKTWITNAVFGLVLALVSWLILFTINPELVRKATLVLPEITLIEAPVRMGFISSEARAYLGEVCERAGGKTVQEAGGSINCLVGDRMPPWQDLCEQFGARVPAPANAEDNLCFQFEKPGGILERVGEKGFYYEVNPEIASLIKNETIWNKHWASQNLLRHSDASIELKTSGIEVTSSSGRLCPNPLESGCTSLEGIPRNTIQTLVKIKKEITKTNPKLAEQIVVTGGTEYGHKNQGFGIGSLDLRYNKELADFLKENQPSFRQKGIYYAVQTEGFSGADIRPKHASGAHISFYAGPSGNEVITNLVETRPKEVIFGGERGIRTPERISPLQPFYEGEAPAR